MNTIFSNITILGDGYAISQDIDVNTGLPYGMNKDYIDQIKPSGIIRTWFHPKNTQSRSGVEQELDLQMILRDNQNGDLTFPSGQTKLKFEEGEHKNWLHEEVAYAFSKADNAESKLIRTGDSIR